MEIGIGFTSGSRKNIKMTIEILGSDYENASSPCGPNESTHEEKEERER